MRLACNVSVGNRQLPELSVRANKKHVKSTLILAQYHKTKDFHIFLYTGQNKIGTRYNVKGNISQILTRFINDGKATIQMKNPPHDLYIQADVIQLKTFLHMVKRVLENKGEPMSIPVSTLAPVAAKDLPRRKLVIKNRGEYPLKGFPRTLEALYINSISRCSVDVGIFRLSRLKILDLSDNCIEFIPEKLAELPNLSELNLSNNHLHKSSPKQWAWMGGKLTKTLRSLNLGSNNLLFLPDQLSRLHQLVSLNVNDNKLTQLPTGFGKLRNLKHLVASNNQLTVLPGSIKNFQLQEINVYKNNFLPNWRHHPAQVHAKVMPVLSLRESAARKVLDCRLSYSPDAIPFTLCDYLDTAKYCTCGKSCLDVFIYCTEMLVISNITRSYVLAPGESPCLPVDCYFCSMKCYKNSRLARSRQPII